MAEMVSRAGNLMMAARVLETEGQYFLVLVRGCGFQDPPKKPGLGFQGELVESLLLIARKRSLTLLEKVKIQIKSSSAAGQ